ncbi:hypothetical protein ANCDUO_00790 [Ancylostoma duodenale]|uniref:Cyclin-like domain-containing protein n=1 Tax=Ancylostoma duodenale TaxID=51022 RepID=A0A0C2H4Y8_9BILA|nr:hypothetical protein ANCDUO_00790 [Ancylostoma duodenale]
MSLRDTAARLKPPPLDISYVNTKNNMIKAERRLLATLGFVVHVKHPHKLICAYCFVLRAHHRTDLIQRAWTYMNDGLRTDMFVRYSPETIACACIFLAARTVQPQVPLPDKPRNWYELFDASDTDVHTIATMLLNMYSNQKASFDAFIFFTLIGRMLVNDEEKVGVVLVQSLDHEVRRGMHIFAV